MEKEYDYSAIERYVKGDMGKDELNAFEEKMKHDQELAAEVEFCQEVADSVQILSYIEEVEDGLAQAELFDAVDKQATQKAKVHHLRFPRSLAFAASMALVLTFSFVIYLQLSLSNRALLNLAEDKMGLSVSLKGENQVADPFAPGLTSLKAGDFAVATAFFETFASDSDLYARAQLFRSIAAWKGEAYGAAEEAAKNAIEYTSNVIVRQKAEWTLVQIYLLTKKTDQLQPLILQIAGEEDHLFAAENFQLQRRLSSPLRRLVLSK